MSLTLGATFFAARNAETENRARFDRAIGNFVEVLTSRMTVYTNALVYSRNLFSMKPSLTMKEFQRFIVDMELRENFPGIQTLGYVARVGRGEAERYGKEAGLDEPLRRLDPDRHEFDIVRHVERINVATSRVLGVDLSRSPERRRAMDRARDLGIPVATSRVLPIDPADPRPSYAFLVFVPRYREGQPVDTVDQRRRALVGFVYGGFRANNLFGQITNGLRFRNAHFSLEIYDGGRVDPGQLLYSETPPPGTTLTYWSEFPFHFANHEWTIRIGAPEEFSIALLSWAPLLVLAFGSALSLIVSLTMKRSQTLAAQLQADLQVRARTERLLKEARKEADEANRAKSIFLANISHEIRTPLGVMIGFAELARLQDSAKEREESLKTVVRNGKELTRIIGDVLDVAKIEAKSFEVDLSPVSLRAVVREMLETWEPQAKAKGLRFDCVDPAAGFPDLFLSDGTRLRQILSNLLSNATKFTSAGFVRFSAGFEGTPEQAGRVCFRVEDSGIGIPREHRDRLFQPFSQGDPSITRQFGGSGLGLALSREIAEALGGTLTLADEGAGPGSCFVLALPYVQPPEEKKPDARDAGPSLEGVHILAVDDSDDNRTLIRLMLEESGARIDIAADGEDGVRQTEKRAYDLVLMDIQMPKMDGYSALGEIRRRGKSMPIVALTANAMTQERERALKAGFDAYVTKPIDRDLLLKTCHELVHRA